MRKYLLLIIIYVGLLNINIFTEENAADFFTKAIGARQIALGSTFIGIADDINTILFNPAGLHNIKYPQIVWEHTSLSSFDTTTDFTIGALPQGIAIGILNNKISDIQLTDEKGNKLGNSSFKETGYIIGYGKKLNKLLSIGVNYRIYKTKFGNFSQEGSGGDLGLLLIVAKNIPVGLFLQNTVELNNGDKIPSKIGIGTSYRLMNDKLLVGLDFDKIKNRKTKHHIGIEYFINPQIALRIGSNDGKFTCGVGLKALGMFDFDLAYLNYEHGIGDALKIQVGYSHKPHRHSTLLQDLTTTEKQKDTIDNPPVINITYPTDGEELKEQTIFVEFIAADDNRVEIVKVNNNPLLFIPDKVIHREKQIDLIEGKNIIEIIATDNKNQSTTKTITVRYEKPSTSSSPPIAPALTSEPLQTSPPTAQTESSPSPVAQTEPPSPVTQDLTHAKEEEKPKTDGVIKLTPANREFLLNNKRYALPIAPIIRENRIFVPLDWNLFELLNCQHSISLNGNSIYINIQKADKKLTFIFDESREGDVKTLYNNTQIELNPQPYLYNSYLMLPISRIYKLLDLNIIFE